MVEGKTRSAALRLEFPCQEAPRMQPCHRHRRTPMPKCLGTANSESGRWRVHSSKRAIEGKHWLLCACNNHVHRSQKPSVWRGKRES